MADPLDLLRASSERLHALVTPLSDDELSGPSYDDDWTIADVLSHIGSGAIIMQRRLDDALAGRPVPDDFAPGVWDVWNAKSPRAKADDGLAADRALIARLGAVTDDERAGLVVPFGPFELDMDRFVGLRVNEHVFHTWDVEVAGDPAAVLPPDGAAHVVDNLAMIARFTAKPTGSDRVIAVRTTGPARAFTVTLTPDAAALTPVDGEAGGSGEPDLALTSEAFARLVYGRLDPDHTPAGVTGQPGTLDELRRVFPGL